MLAHARVCCNSPMHRSAFQRTALALAAMVLGACATPPPPEPPMVPAPIVVAAPPEPVCVLCMDQSQEIARLRQELTARETELRDLRSSQRDQGKAIQESTREVTRAKAKLRRLATQADAASYIAEVEVALSAYRKPPANAPPLVALAQAVLDSTAQPFTRGDYATAMDRAAPAEQLVAGVAEGE